MMYKIMSTVKAHLNEDKRIVSPTQTLLQNNILQTSELMPEKIREKIMSSNVVVDRNSLCKDGICRGDIYVETSDNLSLIEQRQLVNGMTHISKRLKEPLMTPVVIRNAPDVMPEPAMPDEQYAKNDTSMYSETESAFIGAHATLSFPEQIKMKESYRKADSIAKALNRELNAIGLRTVFADMSVCTSENPAVRNCYALMQKTARFNSETFSENRFIDAIKNGFKSSKLNIESLSDIQMIPVANTSALIGSVSLENVQMAGKRVVEQLAPVSNLQEAALAFTSIEQNPLFVNGIGADGEKAVDFVVNKFGVPRHPKITEPVFSVSIQASSNDGFYSSTEQDLSTKWQPANALAFSLTGDKSQFIALYKNMNDIIDTLNESYGCDENHPLITSALFNTKTRISDKHAQSLLLQFNPTVLEQNNDAIKNTITNAFKEAVSEYAVLSGMTINGNQPQPLMIDLKMARPVKQPSVVLNTRQPKNASLQSNMIQDTLENNQQMSF